MKPARGRAVSPFALDEIESRQAGTQEDAARPAPASVFKRPRPYAGNVLLGLAVLTALGGGFTWLAVRPQPRHIEVIIPVPAPIVVQIGGAVVSPGLYTLPPGSRVTDAIAAAGGLTPSADIVSVNQAAKLSDGARVDVPFAKAAPQTANDSTPGASDMQSGAAATSALIDLNTATLAQLESLPNIGPTLAQAIIEFRSKNGPITRVDQLLAVERIGPKTIDAIRPFVTQP